MRKSNKVLMVLTVVVLVASAFMGSIAQAQDDVVELVFIYPTQPTDQNALGPVQEALNVMLEEKIGVHVKLQPMEFPVFRERMPLMNASGEYYDIVFTAPWINNVFQNVTDGNLLALDEYLGDFPVLQAEFSEEQWTAVTVGGHVYGLPKREWYPATFGFLINAEYADAIDMDPQTVESFADLTPWLVKMKEDQGDGFYPIGMVPYIAAGTLGYDAYIGDLVGVPTHADPANPVAEIVPATDVYREFMHLRREWQDLELAPFDPVTREEAGAGVMNGIYGVEFGHQERPNSALTEVRYGIDIYVQGVTEPVLTTGAINSSMLAISSDSNHPEEALMFLELLQTDPEVYNLLAKGVEGVNWNFVDEELGVIELAEDNSYFPNVDWVFGNTFIAYVLDPEHRGWVQESLDMNANAHPSPLLGFVLDTTPIEMEVSAVTALKTEYEGILLNGLTDDVDGTIDEYLSALDAAGIQTIVDEVNSQIQAWVAAK